MWRGLLRFALEKSPDPSVVVAVKQEHEQMDSALFPAKRRCRGKVPSGLLAVKLERPDGDAVKGGAAGFALGAEESIAIPGHS